MYRVLSYNPEIQPYAKDIELRMQLFEQTRARLLRDSGTLSDFANAYQYFGFHRTEGGWVYREWAPAADALYLEGDFNAWNPTSHPLKKLDYGNWEIFLPGEDILYRGCKVKVVVHSRLGVQERVPLYIRRAVQDPATFIYCGEVTDEERYPFLWTDEEFAPDSQLYIYECHVGMSLEEGRIGSFREFADYILPHIQATGYTAIQLMAVMEHPYYGSFGYQVSNFYAASSRFGLPDDLRYLVNRAHEKGIAVILDLVHSHAVKNTADGINLFDGTAEQFFFEGERGDHPAWDTKCFDYGKDGVLHFLLSNLKFWIEEYHVDGFRFDGITSMLYHDHGLGTAFGPDKYFTLNTNVDAITYLQLANELIRQVKPGAITIAEDMSGMPGMCLPIEDGGIGFDYRLAMGIPDMWVRTVRDLRDEDWNPFSMWCEMCLGRPGEKTIGYIESHDQALVGDKTLMFRLADAAMYTDMEKDKKSLVIDRAMAIHKLARLFTLAAGGEAYLTFMGNEFGHPEWIDFPREGNGWSYHYCRRQWSLMWNESLRYRDLYEFDRDMIYMAKEHHLAGEKSVNLLLESPESKILAFARNEVLFAFNFHPERSVTDVRVTLPRAAKYEVIFSSDDEKYGGYGRVAHIEYKTRRIDGKNILELYLPARCAVCLREIKPIRRKKTSLAKKECQRLLQSEC